MTAGALVRHLRVKEPKKLVKSPPNPPVHLRCVSLASDKAAAVSVPAFSSCIPKSVIFTTQRESTRQLDVFRLPWDFTGESCRYTIPCEGGMHGGSWWWTGGCGYFVLSGFRFGDCVIVWVKVGCSAVLVRWWVGWCLVTTCSEVVFYYCMFVNSCYFVLRGI